MSKITDAALQDLRTRYNAAYAAYQSARKSAEAAIEGQAPCAERQENEARAVRDLMDARQNLLDAMIFVRSGHPGA